MNHTEAKSATLTATDLALEVASDNGIDQDALFAAARKTIENEWHDAGETWGEVAVDIFAPVPRSPFGGKFVRFMARFGGPDCELPTYGTVTIMTLFEAIED